MEKYKVMKVISTVAAFAGLAIGIYGNSSKNNAALIIGAVILLAFGALRWIALAKEGTAKNELKKLGKTYIVLAIVIAVVAIIGFMITSTPNETSSSSKRECKVCHKTFESKKEKDNIVRTKMCINCYNNYIWAENAKEAAKEYRDHNQ